MKKKLERARSGWEGSRIEEDSQKEKGGHRSFHGEPARDGSAAKRLIVAQKKFNRGGVQLGNSSRHSRLPARASGRTWATLGRSSFRRNMLQESPCRRSRGGEEPVESGLKRQRQYQSGNLVSSCGGARLSSTKGADIEGWKGAHFR